MLLPLTHERAWVRRQPLVTWAILFICFGVQLHVAFGDGGRASNRLFSDALEIYLRDPRLAPDPRLVDDAMQRQLELMEAFAPRPEGSEVDLESAQQRLDEATARWVASVEEHPLWRHGRVPARGWQGWLSHMFMHGGWLHLIGNLFILYLTGPPVEDHWGRPVFAVFYLVAGLVAGTAFAWQYPDLFRPLVGASGAIAGVMGAFLVLYGTTRITFLLWLGVPVGTVKAPAWVILPLWFALQLLSAATDDAVGASGGGGVAYWAHVWGFVAGVAGAFALRAAKHQVDTFEVLHNTALEAAHAALDRGDGAAAWRLLAEETGRHPANADTTLAFWQLAKDQGRLEAAARPLLALIRDQLERGELHFAVEQWYELRGHLPERFVDPALEAALAAALQDAGAWQSAQVDLLHAALEHRGPRTPPTVALRLGRLAGRQPAHIARPALDRLLEHPGLPADQRATIARQRDALG